MQSDESRQGSSSVSRRHVVKIGAGLVAAPALLAAEQTTRPAQEEPKQLASAGLQNPLEIYPKPPFKPQQQLPPGLASKMDPRPDHGEQSYRGSGKLTGRRALVTGGDSGIGRAAAIAFAREGADVAINYLPVEEPDAKEVVELIRAAGRRPSPFPATSATRPSVSTS